MQSLCLRRQDVDCYCKCIYGAGGRNLRNTRSNVTWNSERRVQTWNQNERRTSIYMSCNIVCNSEVLDNSSVTRRPPLYTLGIQSLEYSPKRSTKVVIPSHHRDHCSSDISSSVLILCPRHIVKIRKSTRLNSSHEIPSRMPSSA